MAGAPAGGTGGRIIIGRRLFRGTVAHFAAIDIVGIVTDIYPKIAVIIIGFDRQKRPRGANFAGRTIGAAPAKRAANPFTGFPGIAIIIIITKARRITGSGIAIGVANSAFTFTVGPAVQTGRLKRSRARRGKAGKHAAGITQAVILGMTGLSA